MSHKKKDRDEAIKEYEKRKDYALEKMTEYYKKNRDNGVDLWLDQAMAELEAANKIRQGKF